MQPETFAIGAIVGAVLSFCFGHFCGRLYAGHNKDKETDGMSNIIRNMIGKIAPNETYSVTCHISRIEESDDGGGDRQTEPEPGFGFEYWRNN